MQRCIRRGRPWLFFVMMLATGLLISAGMTTWVTHHRVSDQSNDWRVAVYRFDTGTLFSCEASARDMARPPFTDADTPRTDQWVRLPLNQSRGRISPACLIQAGLLAL